MGILDNNVIFPTNNPEVKPETRDGIGVPV